MASDDAVQKVLQTILQMGQQTPDYGQSQNISVGGYQMPSFGSSAPAPVQSYDDHPGLIAPDGLPFWQMRSGENHEGRQARLQPYYDRVGALQQQYSPKPPETWTPQELERFRRTPQFVEAARLSFPRSR